MKNYKNKIVSVNFHLWQPCNMRCKFCYAKFQDVKETVLPKGHLSREDSIQVVRHLAYYGFKKITFAGGEPTLCPWLGDLIRVAKESGMATMVVTNGTGLCDEFLNFNRKYLDWIAISIDSMKSESNLLIGRAICGTNPFGIDDYKIMVDRVKSYGYGLKINTVVNRFNFQEDLTEFIRYAAPKRWKLLQVLPVEGQNENDVQPFVISVSDFNDFISLNKGVKQITTVVSENNNEMTGSYVMVDPAGRFFDNTEGRHTYSRPILEIGCGLAYQQIAFDADKFEKRGGIYDWESQKCSIPERITLSGDVASGKSSVGKLLAKELGYEFTSIGEKTRQFASSLGMEISEFQRYCLSNPAQDRAIDQDFIKDCAGKSRIVIDYRMGFHFIQGAFNIYLKVDEIEAMNRIDKQQRASERSATVPQRNNSFKQQFLNTHGIDFTDPVHYDLIVDTGLFETPRQVVDAIRQHLNKNLAR